MATKNQFNIESQTLKNLERTVEVAEMPAKAKVVREGFQVPAVEFNTQAAEFFLDNLQVLQSRQTPRVIAQRTQPGTRVTAGTVVDLVLAPVNDIPFGIFEGVHRDLRERSVAGLLDGILQDPTTRQTLLKYEKADDVPQAERNALTQQFQAADIGIDDAVADASFAAAYKAARGALAFK